MSNNYKEFFKEKISLIASNPGCGKLEVVINLLNELGIRKKRKLSYLISMAKVDFMKLCS